MADRITSKQCVHLTGESKPKFSRLKNHKLRMLNQQLIFPFEVLHQRLNCLVLDGLGILIILSTGCNKQNS